MSSYDLSHLTSPESAEPFTVDLPGGDTLTLRPIVALPTEGQAAMLRLTGKLSGLAGGEVGEDGIADLDLGEIATSFADALEDVDTLLRAACPSKTAANKLMRVVGGALLEKVGLVVAYISQEQAGEASASAS